MPIKLLKSETALEDIQDHLKEYDLVGSPVESYLAQFLVVVFSSEIEDIVRVLTQEKVRSLGGEKLIPFFESMSKKLLRSVQKSELSGYLGNFGEDVKQDFKHGCDDNDVRLFDIVIRARHRVSHTTGTQVSLNDVVQGIDAGHRIMGAFESALLGTASDE
ncbi:MAG: hypothetical protein AAFX76_10740 [Planctomycetota bacterium]